jgi:hypothetical protein
MKLLISKSDFLTYKLVSRAVTDVRIDTYIQEAQFTDLRCLMGDRLYYDVLTNESDYADLIDGSEFTAKDGIVKDHYGLKAVLVYLSWARYSMFGSVQDTAFGSVTKTNEWSQPESQSSKRDRRDQAMQVANTHWAMVREYLDVSAIPAWEAHSKCGSSKCGNGGKKCNSKIRVIR